jgi:tetratricopeptide (TPR) repeat protein
MLTAMSRSRGLPAQGRSAAALAGMALGVLGVWAAPVAADPSSPAVEQRRQPPYAADADSEYDRGVRARVARDWTAAAEAFQRAVERRPDLADAWNELGYALRHLGRYPESLKAYDEALRLRPDFPEALEYLGEAYVQMGWLADARRVLDRLRPLDAGRARELAEDIGRAERGAR